MRQRVRIVRYYVLVERGWWNRRRVNSKSTPMSVTPLIICVSSQYLSSVGMHQSLLCNLARSLSIRRRRMRMMLSTFPRLAVGGVVPEPHSLQILRWVLFHSMVVLCIWVEQIGPHWNHCYYNYFLNENDDATSAAA